jgi:CHAD domain-containing protein
VDKTRRGDEAVEKLRLRVLDDLDEAVASLSILDLDPVGAVHETRKRVKTIRAALRLVESADKARFRREDTILAQATGRLGPIRDQHVAQHLASHLGRWPGDTVPPPLAPSVRARVNEAGMALLGARNRANRWDLHTIDNETLIDGLDRSYRLARRRWRRAAGHLETENLHHCRKSVKRVTNQLRVVSDRLAASSRVAELEKLGDLLGQHHDLSLVPDHDPHDQTELESEILASGTLVFALTPKNQQLWVAGTLA